MDFERKSARFNGKRNWSYIIVFLFWSLQRVKLTTNKLIIWFKWGRRKKIKTEHTIEYLSIHGTIITITIKRQTPITVPKIIASFFFLKFIFCMMLFTAGNLPTTLQVITTQLTITIMVNKLHTGIKAYLINSQDDLQRLWLYFVVKTNFLWSSLLSCKEKNGY